MCIYIYINISMGPDMNGILMVNEYQWYMNGILMGYDIVIDE